MIGYYLIDNSGISVKDEYGRSALIIYFRYLRNSNDKNILVSKFSEELNIDVDYINDNYTLKSDYSEIEAEKKLELKKHSLKQREYLKTIEYSLELYTDYLCKNKIEVTGVKLSPISKSVYLSINNKFIFRLSDHYLPNYSGRPTGYIGEYVSERSKNIQINKSIIHAIKTNIC